MHRWRHNHVMLMLSSRKRVNPDGKYFCGKLFQRASFASIKDVTLNVTYLKERLDSNIFVNYDAS